MIYRKTNPFNIEKKIDLIQTSLSQLDWGALDIFGILEPTEKCRYNHNGEYIDPFFNDKVYASFAFKATQLDYSNNTAEIVLICTFYDKNKNTFELINELTKKLRIWGKLGLVKIGVDEVFTGFDKKRYRDMQPFGCFSIELSTIFSKQCN